MSKQKTIDLLKVMKPNGKAFGSFDSSIKNIIIEREYQVDGETITEKVKVVPNNEYLSGTFINKFKDQIEFKRGKGWISDEKANSDLKYAEEKGISSVFSVKVESI
jgi:hypothetical protein